MVREEMVRIVKMKRRKLKKETENVKKKHWNEGRGE